MITLLSSVVLPVGAIDKTHIKHCQMKFSWLTGQSVVFHSLITRRATPTRLHPLNHPCFVAHYI